MEQKGKLCFTLGNVTPTLPSQNFMKMFAGFFFRSSAVRVCVSVCERACTGARMRVYVYASVYVYVYPRACVCVC